MKYLAYFAAGFVAGLIGFFLVQDADGPDEAADVAPAVEATGAAACDEPVMMLVFGTIEKPELLDPYVAGLQSINTYPEQQGYYILRRPFELLEGEWPEDRMFIGAHFPCAAAARGFWFSEDYQSVRPVRAGMGPLSVSLHKVEDPPDWVNGEPPLRLYEPRPTQPNPQ
ncbi:MAG: DUF1330 domain-containing protein [Xanthomonadales bacterium]|nr:DUF1330 domain-containing protein [Xanthomonadales bacterium]